MGFDNFRADDGEESSGGNKSTYVTFKNPSVADVPEDSAHRHKQEYYDAAKAIRDRLGQDINVLFGEFAAAAQKADEGDPEQLKELFDELTAE